MIRNTLVLLRPQRASAANRKQLIAHRALELFAESGFGQVPTQRIAKAAGVSEALICLVRL